MQLSGESSFSDRIISQVYSLLLAVLSHVMGNRAPGWLKTNRWHLVVTHAHPHCHGNRKMKQTVWFSGGKLPWQHHENIHQLHLLCTNCNSETLYHIVTTIIQNSAATCCIVYSKHKISNQINMSEVPEYEGSWLFIWFIQNRKLIRRKGAQPTKILNSNPACHWSFVIFITIYHFAKLILLCHSKFTKCSIPYLCSAPFKRIFLINRKIEHNRVQRNCSGNKLIGSNNTFSFYAKF